MTPKIGLVGCGRWGRYILRDLKSLGCHVTVASRSEGSIANAHEYGADDIVDTAERLSADLDGYVVASPTVSHLPVTRALIDHKKPIYVEKPLTHDLAGAKALLALAREHVFIMHKWRYHPGVLALQSIAATGEFGRVQGLRSVRKQWLSPHSDVDAIWILAPHDVSIATHILGEVPTPVSASADPIGPAGSGLTGQLVDEATGARIEISVSASSPVWKREIVLGCKEAVISMGHDDYTSIEIRRWPDSSAGPIEPETRSVDDSLPLFLELEAFVGHVRGGPPPTTSLQEEVRMLEVLAQLRAMAGLDGGVPRDGA